MKSDSVHFINPIQTLQCRQTCIIRTIYGFVMANGGEAMAEANERRRTLFVTEIQLYKLE